ncbi:MAG: diacylglycerol kinase family lipid kinase [Chloroflexi bacterium]|nr:diacylglycerol kinase family lipid kinase [Chloroflexota bacterium]
MRALLIHNPAAGQGHLQSQVSAAVDVFNNYGWEIEVHETTGPGSATEISRQAVDRRLDAVLISGGDGSLNEALNGLVGSPVALGVLPTGTANVWAAQIGLLSVPSPLSHPSLVEVAHRLATGQVRFIDVGLADNRYFFLWCGIGFDAAIAHYMETTGKQMKRRLGAAAFIVRGFFTALRFTGQRASLLLDGRKVTLRLLWVLVSNIRLYGGLFDITPQAVLDDGYFDIVTFRGRDFGSLVRHLLSIVTRGRFRNPELRFYRAKHIQITTRPPMPVHLDAEPAGISPVDIRLLPKGLKVLVPASIPADLFQ